MQIGYYMYYHRHSMHGSLLLVHLFSRPTLITLIRLLTHASVQTLQPLLLTSASHTRGWHIHRASYITEGHSVESLCVIIENLHCQFEGVWCDSWCTSTRSCGLWMMYGGKWCCIHVHLIPKAHTMKYSW